MLIFLTVTICAFALSLSTKLIADALLHERIPVFGSFAGLLYTRNPGIAFGLQLGEWQTLLITIALVLVIIAAVRSKRSVLSDTGFGLIVGGALGNIVDRLPDGFVTDFFQVGTFPVFNVADSCITVGVILLLAESLFSSLNTQYRR